MPKYYSTLKFMWKECDAKLLDNFRKIFDMLENATLEIWTGFRAFYNVDRTGKCSLTVFILGSRLGPQIWQSTEKVSPKNSCSWIALSKRIKHGKL